MKNTTKGTGQQAAEADANRLAEETTNEEARDWTHVSKDAADLSPDQMRQIISNLVGIDDHERMLDLILLVRALEEGDKVRRFCIVQDVISECGPYIPGFDQFMANMALKRVRAYTVQK